MIYGLNIGSCCSVPLCQYKAAFSSRHSTGHTTHTHLSLPTFVATNLSRSFLISRNMALSHRFSFLIPLIALFSLTLALPKFPRGLPLPTLPARPGPPKLPGRSGPPGPSGQPVQSYDQYEIFTIDNNVRGPMIYHEN